MSISVADKRLLQANPAKFIKQQIKEYVLHHPANRLSFKNEYMLWDNPLVRFANGDASIFVEYKNIIAPVHLTPREALALCYNQSPENMPKRLSVISWILPIALETRTSNRTEKLTPGRLWSHTRYYGEKANDILRTYLVKLLTDAGYLAVAPIKQSYFKVYNNENGPYSNWSERHIAYAAGHGTFSLSDGFITERGIAHRCGSIVTSLILPINRKISKTPFSNCLFYAGVNCKACINRCPAEAINASGHDKVKCQNYLQSIGHSRDAFKDGYNNDNSVAGCGLCQTKVPCEFQNPIKKLRKKVEH
jgi:epoxyqueuosine reductase QueG